MYWPHAVIKSGWGNKPLTSHLAKQIWTLQWLNDLIAPNLGLLLKAKPLMGQCIVGPLKVMLWAVLTERHQSDQPLIIKFLYLLLTNTYAHIHQHTHTSTSTAPQKHTEDKSYPKADNPLVLGQCGGDFWERKEEEKKEEVAGDKSKVNFSSGEFLNDEKSLFLFSVCRMVEEVMFEFESVLPSLPA